MSTYSVNFEAGSLGLNLKREDEKIKVVIIIPLRLSSL
jgi:hypothetical protein